MRNHDSNEGYYVRSQSVTLLQGNDSTDVIDRVVSTKITDSPDTHGIDVLFCDYNGRITDIGSIYKIKEKILRLSKREMGKQTFFLETEAERKAEAISLKMCISAPFLPFAVTPSPLPSPPKT